MPTADVKAGCWLSALKKKKQKKTQAEILLREEKKSVVRYFYSHLSN